MSADNDIVNRLRALSRCEHSDLSVGDEAAAEIVRLRGVVDAMETCAVKYLGWLGVKDATAALRKDMADPEMLGHAIAPAEAKSDFEKAVDWVSKPKDPPWGAMREGT